MKRIILFALGLIPAQLWAQSSNFTLNAKIGQIGAPAKAYLRYQVDDKLVTETADVTNGSFKFTGTIIGPTSASLALDHKGEGLDKLGPGSDMLMVILEKGDVNFSAKDSIRNAVSTGSKLNDENKVFTAFALAAQKQMAKLNAEYEAAPDFRKSDPEFQEDLQTRANQIGENLIKQQHEFIKKKPDSYFSLIALIEQSNQSQEVDIATLELLYKNLSINLRNSAAGIEFGKKIATAHGTAVGAMAPVFTQNDVNGKPVSLTDFRGKYVLLDFWASWCGPCRKENPNVVKAYNQYKDKNFTVLGVSLDQPGKKEDWLAAIKADGLEWTQVSDLKFWNNETAKLYLIKSIPQNFLIDPTGKIIGKNLRGENLTKKLASILN